MVRKSVVFLAACLVLAASALAQNSQPQCSLSASPTLGAPPLLVTATANCTDPGNDITSVTLDWGDGSPPYITAQTAFQAQHVYATGTFTLTLTASDLSGLNSVPQTATVTANAPPSCTLNSVSPTSGSAPLTVSASGSCTDPENDITATSINWGDGPPTNGTSGTHTYNRNGTYSIVLSAQDSAGNTGSSPPQTVTVSPNTPPSCTLSVSPTSGSAPLTVTATGNCSDPDGDTLTEVLDWGDHTATSGTSGTHTYTARGNYKITLTATDSANLNGSASQNVSVTRNGSPTCTLTVAPNSGAAPLTVTATALCSDADGDTLTVALSWGDGATSNGATGTHTYTAPGNYTVTVTATDPFNNSGTASQAVSVGSTTPACSPQVSPTSGNAPLSLTVTANCSDPGNDLTTVVTDFGDGFYLTGNSVTHTYVSGGSYTLTVVAHDRAGKASQAFSQAVNVSDDPVLFVGISNGQVAQFSKSGNNQRTLNSNQGGSITGMALDALENLYTSDFTADTVTRFNGAGTLAGTFGSGYNCKPESIVFDRSGNAYVGETGCSHAILKFDAYGNLAAAYTVATEQEGSDWIDLASDQCTLLYTSQGPSVLAYNVCTKQQLPAFATGLNTGLAVKILPDQSVLVADKQDVIRFDHSGHKIMTYDASGENCFVSLTLDSDKTSFWAADYCTSDVVRFDISSGNEMSKFNSGTAANTVYGVMERVDPPAVAAAGPLIPSPAQASVSSGQSANFALSFTPNGAAAGQTFTFSCAGLPANSSCSFSPSSVQAGGGALSTQLTISTGGATAQLAPPGTAWEWALALALPGLGMMFALAGADDRRRRKRLLIMLVLLACLLPLLSCSGASGNSSSPSSPSNPASPPTPGSSTPAGAYTVVVHASSSGGPQSSTAVTLTVQ